MKKQILFFIMVLFCALSLFAQTPYDNFAPEQSIKSIIELPKMQFKVVNTDTNSEICYVEFDKNTLSLNLLNENDSVIKMVGLNPNDKKFLTMDPHAENYYSVSPYSFCLGNPIRFIDPDGRDVWEVNETGEIVNRIKDKTQDAFFMVAKDADGNYQRTFMTDAEGNKNYNSISFKYGTVESQRTTAINSTDSYDTYKVRGDANGTQMFEFMSQNTTVEWSQAKTGIAGDKGLNFLTTSHDAATEHGMSNLYSGQLYAGYTIRELNHSHPSNTGYPSGSFVHPTTGQGVGEWGDVGFARSITNNRQANRLNIPTFNIFLPASKSYLNYGPNSIRSNYGR